LHTVGAVEFSAHHEPAGQIVLKAGVEQKEPAGQLLMFADPCGQNVPVGHGDCFEGFGQK